jgi:regulator of sigma E protease
MLANLTNLASLIVVLGIIIFVHEFGHLLAAKAFGMRVLVFSFGFGTRLFGFKWGETDCRLSLLPLGGYVKIAGEGDDHLSESTAEAVTDDGRDFGAHPRWQRFLMYLAGPAMNAALTFTIFSVLFTIAGARVEGVRFDLPILGVVDEGSPAAQAGLAAGDLIVSIDGEGTPTWDDAQIRILHAAGRTISVVVRRSGTDRTIAVKVGTEGNYGAGTIGASALVRVGRTEPDQPAQKGGVLAEDGILAVRGMPIREFEDILGALEGQAGTSVPFRILRGGEILEVLVTPQLVGEAARVGIWQKISIKRFGPFGAVVEAGRETWRNVRQTIWTVKQLITARISARNLQGPLGIAKVSGDAARSGGPASLILLAAFLSVQVGILNLLPIPPLDGGHMLFLSVEGALRRDLSTKVKEVILMTGLGLLLALIVFVFYSDLTRTKLFSFLPH